MLNILVAYVAVLALSSSSVLAKPEPYAVKTPPLTTPWTYKVGTSSWQEYPRPQLKRSEWKNLNGVWSWRKAKGFEELSNVPSGSLEKSVLIPSCLESGLSGIMAPVEEEGSVVHSWFQTTFTLPSSWSASNTIINFDAVDYEATVFVNGHNATFHRGGYTRFSADITPYLKEGDNELVVFVYDPTDSVGDIPIGKQTNHPSHIFYTPCTGIWQTVWLESVPKVHIESLDVTANMKGELILLAHSSDASKSPIHVVVYDHDGKAIAEGEGSSDTTLNLNVDGVKLWTPDSPNLYDFTVKLGEDEVRGYTGFRTIEKGVVHGITRALLNGEILFAFGPLDQGYWPDGLYTPPSYEALKYDLEITKSLNMNMLRKHIKVEPDLFYRACDEMGLLVIQDMPSMTPEVTPEHPNAEEQAEWERQLEVMIQTHKSFTCIYTWVIYNEGWGQRGSLEIDIEKKVRELDPTRLIDATSGWHDHGAGDFSDNHHYSNAQCGAPINTIDSSPYDTSRIGFQGEFGGVGLNTSIEHLWNESNAIALLNQTYEVVDDLATWNSRAHIILREMLQQTHDYACSGGVWTATTDVEGEVNGFLTYDRRVMRADVKQWRDDLQALYEAAKTGGSYWRDRQAREAGLSGDLSGLGQVVFQE